MSAVEAAVPRSAPRPWHRQAARRYPVLIANGSASGLGRSPHALEDARRALASRGARVETRLTESVSELAEARPDLQDRRVVLLGGDGTVHAAANLRFGPPELAVLPAGRANNVARALGIPLDLGAAADLATSGRVRPIDLIWATNGARSMLVVEGAAVSRSPVARRVAAPASGAGTHRVPARAALTPPKEEA